MTIEIQPGERSIAFYRPIMRLFYPREHHVFCFECIIKNKTINRKISLQKKKNFFFLKS